MKRSQLNLCLDAALLLGLAAMAGIGFLIKWVLIPGRERPAVYGSNVDLYWLGLDRHAWGTVHLGIGLGMLALVGVHVALHWSGVVGVFRGMVAGRAARALVVIALVILVLALMAFPALVSPEVVEGRGGEGRGGRGRGYRGGRAAPGVPSRPGAEGVAGLGG